MCHPEGTRATCRWRWSAADDGAVTYAAFAVDDKGRLRRWPWRWKTPSAVPDVPDLPGTRRGFGRWRLPRHRRAQIDPAGCAQACADLWASLDNDPEMKELAAKSGFELVNVGPDQMDAFMKERPGSTPRGRSDSVSDRITACPRRSRGVCRRSYQRITAAQWGLETPNDRHRTPPASPAPFSSICTRPPCCARCPCTPRRRICRHHPKAGPS